ncbi:trypsin-like serine peptidase [Pseudaestuariivita rosea]|uniref:trypsin-like serine peptidase n=1 Tax=Pseudaestuariivita rosea TaxID=2763263 RepID=UPI001ABA2BAB|nr:trypsin-like serine protease [Pseudaestuariivita rosea]
MIRFFLCLLIAVSPSVVFSDDTGLKRLTQRDDLFGWEAVGRVDISGKGTCTGALIAKNLVLTAAHCLVDDKAVNPSRITFRAGYRDGESLAERQISRLVLHPAYDLSLIQPRRDPLYDVALLELDQPISIGLADPYLVEYPSRNAKTISVVSYARDRNEALSWQRRCSVLGRRDGLIAFNCDVYYGSSGAPVFELKNERLRVVSIVSRGTRDERGVIAIGMELPEVVEDLKRAFRTGQGVVTTDRLAQPVSRTPNRGLPQSNGSGAKFLKP